MHDITDTLMKSLEINDEFNPSLKIDSNKTYPIIIINPSDISEIPQNSTPNYMALPIFIIKNMNRDWGKLLDFNIYKTKCINEKLNNTNNR